MENTRQDVSTADRALPENDGMYLLRHELQEIRMLAVSTEEKARRMHELMMKDFVVQRFEPEAPSSPSFPHGGDADGQVHSSPTPDVDPQNPYNIQPGDVDPTFCPLSINPQELENGLEDESDEEMVPDLGCVHYKRNVKLQCFDCRRWFTCRHCHDLSIDLPFPHVLNRKQTQNMLCMLCQTPQPASEVCVNCGEYAAWYYCPKCKLWDNDSNKRIYHCDDCGICRVGEGLGKDFVHCRRCNVCISISTADSHPCVERATEGNCPLCLVPLFESRTPVVSLPCGHYMHGTCYKELMAVTYKCPVCSKSAVNMEIQWRKLDDAIQAQPMPRDDEDLDGLLPHAVWRVNIDAAAGDRGHVTSDSRQQRPKAVWIACNDCGGRSWSPFHWLGLKCQTCDSYNTSQMAPSAGHETEAERVLRQSHVHEHHNFTGNAALREAGINGADETQRADSALDVPHSPANQPSSPPTTAAATTTTTTTTAPHSPGRYFVQEEAPRRPSFTGHRFSAPSMATLPSLADMPRMPRMPNIELPRFSPYGMIDAVSRSLSPMRYYLQGLDLRDDEQPARRPTRPRPKSVQSEPFRSPLGPQLRPRSAGSAELHSWDEETFDAGGDGDGSQDTEALDEDAGRSERGSMSGDSEEEEGSEDEDEEGDGLEGDDDDHEEIDIFGHP